METLKVGLVQVAPLCDAEVSRELLAARIREAAQGGAGLVVLPELCQGPYFCQSEDVRAFDLAEPVPGPSTAYFGGVARACGVVLVVSLFERRAPGLYHNTVVVLERDGSVAGIYRKMHIPDDPGYYEKFYFAPGDLGFRPVQTSVGRLGVQVCWDQWFPEGARLMALGGADLLIYPTAIGYDASDAAEEQARQREAWQTVQRGHAVANGLPVVCVNRTGREGAIRFWGSSFAVGPQGEWLARMEEEEEGVRLVDVDLGRTETVRRWWPFLRDRRIDAYGGLTRRWLYDE